MQKRRRFLQSDILEDRLAAEAIRLREEAKAMPPGLERDLLLRKARQAETGAHMSEWLRSPGLKPPTSFTDAEQAKRFRDKAAEALQLIELATSEGRRQSLQQIADSYNRAAENLEGLPNAAISEK